MTGKTKIDRHGLALIGIGLTLSTILALILQWDPSVTRYAVLNAPPGSVVMAQIFSVMGNPTFYMAFSALAFIHFRFIQFNSIQANRALFFLLSVVTSIICVSILKATFGRARPDLYFEYGVYGFRPFYMGQAFSSFPSEHAAIAATIAAMLSLIRPTYRIAFCALALFVAASRVLLMAHYVSDVLAGLLLGGLIVFELKIAFDHFGQSLQIGNSRQGRTRS